MEQNMNFRTPPMTSKGYKPKTYQPQSTQSAEGSLCNAKTSNKQYMNKLLSSEPQIVLLNELDAFSTVSEKTWLHTLTFRWVWVLLSCHSAVMDC